MIRLLGILSGSALAVALMIALLGVPDLASREVPVALPPVPAIESPAEDAPPPEAVEASAVTIPEPAPTEPDEAVAEELAIASLPAAKTPPAPAAVDEPEAYEEHWYAFWSPFNSQLAANGFIAQLQRTTGLDYRVVKLKPGVYEVAFAYVDDADIETKLAQISSATGLEIPGS